MVPSIVVANGRWLRAPLFVAAAITIGGALGGWRVAEMTPAPASIRAPWVDACAARMERVRLQLSEVAPELGRAYVGQAWTLRAAWAELRLHPQYSARIEYRPAEDLPSVFDWEEAPTPVAGSFALHRRVGHYD